MESETNKLQSFTIPIAIIIGFGLIALAIYATGGVSPIAGTNNATGEQMGAEETAGDLENLNPVTEADHIRGNPNAPIVFVEYSDYDCPFCKNFHETMKRILEEYGADGRVAWVYRHFPLQSLHPSAPRIAEASECVAKLGGNTAFWTFSDLVFEERDTNELTDMSRLPSYAERSGVDVAAFNACLESGEMRAAVEEDFNNALAIGGQGTPHSVVLMGDEQGVINGAQPYATVRQIVEGLLSESDAIGGQIE